MNEIIVHVYEHAAQTANQIAGMEVSDIITAGISLLTLLLNILFYIIIAPKISFKFQKKDEMLKYASEFISYLAEVNSFKEFDGVPTKVKSYCVSIELLFKDGVAPQNLRDDMETVFQAVKKRKEITDANEISTWETEFRAITHKLRVSIAKYTGWF